VSSVANQRTAFVIEGQWTFTKTRQKHGTYSLFLKYISLPSSPKRQREMTKFCVFWRTWTTTDSCYYYTLNYLFSDWRRTYSGFSKLAPMTSSTLKVTGNHAMYDRGAWFVRLFMSSSGALCCLPSVKKQKLDFHYFFSSMCNKTIIIFDFCDIQHNQGLGKGYQPQLSASADNRFLDLDYSGYHKNLIRWLFRICISNFTRTVFHIQFRDNFETILTKRNMQMDLWVSRDS